MSQDASFGRFLKSGQLGPLTLGMSPSSVEVQLGTPEQSSRKAKPLILKYGALELTFWARKSEPPQLAQISLILSRGLNRLPPAIRFEDWQPNVDTSIEDFKMFVERVHVRIDESTVGPMESELLLRSGVRALFVRGYLASLHMSKRESDSNRPPILNDEREPTAGQIRSQLQEARLVLQSGFPTAAVLLAWAVLEAVLRRAALNAGYMGKLRVQPTVLIRELYSLGRLTQQDFEMLEFARQRRTSIAHGLRSDPVSPHEITQILDFAQRLFDSLPVAATEG